MSRSCLAAAALLAACARALAAEPAQVEGRMDGDGIHVEILGRPVVVGERVDLPEGWFRVEEQGIEDRRVGSFSVVTLAEPVEPAAPDDQARPAPTVQPAQPEPAPQAAPAESPCGAQRAAYLRELLKTSGVEVEDPDAVLEGLDSGTGAATGSLWLALQTDPVRPLAWSSDLRERARALARCVKEHRPAPAR